MSSKAAVSASIAGRAGRVGLAGEFPVGWWRFHEGSGLIAVDETDSGNDGTLAGGVGRILGPIDGAVAFDGIDDRVTVPHAAALEGFTALTLYTVFRPHQSTGQQFWSRLISKAASTDSDDYGLMFRPEGTINFRLRLGGISVDLQSATLVAANTWTKVVGTWDGSQMRLFIDDIEDANSPLAASGSLGASGGALAFGSHANSPGDRRLDGDIDEIRLYSHALSVADHTALPGKTSATTYDELVTSFAPNVVSYWKFQNDGVDVKAVEHAPFTGSATELNVDTIVYFDRIAEGALVDGKCIAWPGTAGNYAQAAHNSAHKTAQGAIVVTFQHDELAQKSVLVASDANGAAGGLSVEVTAAGEPRAFLRRQSDGAPIIILGQAGDVQLGRAYTAILKWGSAGLSLALWDNHGQLVRRVTNALADGAAGTSPIRFGAWHNDTSHHAGPFARVVWLNRRISDAEEAELARARTITRAGVSTITLAPLYVWADEEGNGEYKTTDTATEGTIQSASGGTLPAFPITVDPTPYVSGATGTKSAWQVEFRNSTLGTWERLTNGDLRFTPGTTAGYDNSEYRVSDDAGATWTDWHLLQTLVLQRNLAPAPYFLIEDFSGTNQQKLDLARDAAATAGGGTVTTLQRSTVLTGIANHAPRPSVHYLFCNLQKPTSVHTPTGATCSPAGNGQCLDWTTNEQTNIITGVTNRNAIADSGVRINFVGGVYDGNSFQQALHQTSGDNATPSSNCGTCWPGNRSSSDFFNLQFGANFRFRGKDGVTAAEQEKVGLYGLVIKNSVADGVRGAGAVDAIIEDCILSGCARGSLVFDVGGDKLRSTRNRMITGEQSIGGGLDHEFLPYTAGGGSTFGDLQHTDDFVSEDFDLVIRSNSSYVFSGLKAGPGLNFIARTASGAVCTYQGSTANPRAVLRYHVRGGGTGGSFPRCGLLGWSNDGPHSATFRFINTDFLTHHDPYVYHANTFTPADGQTWEIQVGETVDTTSAFRIELTNCTVQKTGTHTGTYRLFRTVKALTTAQIVRIDGLTIGSGFAQDAIQLNGQRLEYRNIAHADFPSATITQICPGAGEYINIDSGSGGGGGGGGGSGGELGTVTAIADNNHPNLMWTDAEIVALRNLINAGTFSDLNAAWSRVEGKTAILIPGSWPSTYPESAQHARPANHNNLLACISYAVAPTTAKANAIRNALNDMKNRFPNGRRGDLNYGSWHHSWAWMFDLIQAYHPGHFTAQERTDMKEWCRRNANVNNSIRTLSVRSELLSHSEYNAPVYDVTDANKRITFYTNWYARALCPTGAMALVSGSQAQVDFYFQSWGVDHKTILDKSQITNTFPPDGLNRFDLIMYVLAHHPHGENSDTWAREHYRHPQNDFNTGTYGRYHPSTSHNVFMAAEMAYRNGMTGIFSFKDEFVSVPYLQLVHEFMYDHRNALNRNTGQNLIPAFRFHWAGLAWARYDTTKINALKTEILNQTDQRGDDGGDIPDDFGIIYKYPRRIPSGGGPAPDLPFFGQYYGSAFMGHNAANTVMRNSSEYGTHWFFYAERTGVIDKVWWHRRTGTGYSGGDGGKYTFEIRAADPNTRRPLLGVQPVCKIDNILPGNPGNAGAQFITDFTTTGQVVAKQPYCFVYRNTHADPSNNYFSSNISHQHSFWVSINPPDYEEPAGANPANPGSSPTPVAGWTPVRIDGSINFYPWPCKGAGGDLHYRRIGPEILSFRYTDGQWVGWGSCGGGSTYRATISGSNQGRERFRVTRVNRVVSGVFIRIPRYNATTGNLIVTLESGPASDTSGNGTTIEQITVPHTAIYDVGGSEDHSQDSASEVTDFVPFLWVPFSQNRTLTVGQLYNLRLSATGSLSCQIWNSSRSDNQGLGPNSTSLTWDQWEAQRQISWASWEDSRGFMTSSNSGSSWSYFIGRLSPIIFKCVV